MNLQLFLSDRCNMACDYCWLALNRGKAVVLKEADARRAVREHLERFGANAQVTLLGGEPLIHADLALAIVREARRGAAVSIATNGTLACPETLRALSRLGAQIVLSLDGTAASHDAHRPFVSERKPTHAEILKALESADVPLRVNMVVSPDTAPALLRNAEWLRARGFRRLSFHPDVMASWDEAALAALSSALDGFARYHRALPAGALELTNLSSYRPARSGPSRRISDADDEVILGADGFYYPCDGLFAKRYAELSAWRIGSAASGVDWDKRKAFLDEARGFCRSAGVKSVFPREAYFRARATGGDPRAAVLSFDRVNALFVREMTRLAEGREAVRGR